MSALPVRERLLAKLDKLNDKQIVALLDFIDAIQGDDESEEEWEEKILTEALGDALRPDGSVDFDQLRKTGVTMTPDEFDDKIESADDGDTK